MPFTEEEEQELRRLLAQATPQEIEEIAEGAAEEAVEAVAEMAEDAPPEEVEEAAEHAAEAVEAEEAVEEAIDNGEMETAISETVEAVEESGNATDIAGGDGSDSALFDDAPDPSDAVPSEPVPDASPRPTHWYWRKWGSRSA